jgi:hypothetical protein
LLNAELGLSDLTLGYLLFASSAGAHSRGLTEIPEGTRSLPERGLVVVPAASCGSSLTVGVLGRYRSLIVPEPKRKGGFIGVEDALASVFLLRCFVIRSVIIVILSLSIRRLAQLRCAYVSEHFLLFQEHLFLFLLFCNQISFKFFHVHSLHIQKGFRLIFPFLWFFERMVVRILASRICWCNRLFFVFFLE